MESPKKKEMFKQSKGIKISNIDLMDSASVNNPPKSSKMPAKKVSNEKSNDIFKLDTTVSNVNNVTVSGSSKSLKLGKALLSSNKDLKPSIMSKLKLNK
jgi:hypothetical protein